MLSLGVSPKRVFMIRAIVVALSAFFLASVRGYGTDLFQIVVLGAWTIFAAITSGRYADLHSAQVWALGLWHWC